MGVSWNKPPSQASAHILATFSLFILPAAPVWPHWSSRQEQDSKSPWPLLALFQYEIPGGSVGKWIVHRTSDLENWYRWSCLQSRNRDTENRRLTTERGKLGWMNRETGIYIYICTDIYALLIPVAHFVKNLPAGDMGLIPGSRRSPGEGNSNHSSILVWVNPMGRGA